MKLKTSKAAKLIAGLVGLTMALSFVVSPATASADANSDLITSLSAQLTAAMAQLSALKGGGSSVAVGTSFDTNLTVGSRGSDVSALQNILISKGFLSASATGYFGALTKAAVIKWQNSVGLPATGFVGPLSRAALNNMSSVAVTPVVTPVVIGGSVTCPVGYTCSPATTGGSVVTGNGSDGSITLSYSPYVTSSQTVKKGESKDVYAVKLQATSGPVTVNRFDIHFSERPWLIFSQLVLKDVNGGVIATKQLNSSADATEITVGTDYLVRFDNVNTVVTPGTDKTMVVGLTVRSDSDKVQSQTVTISLPSGSIRTINGRGYTDSLGGLQSNTVTLTATGSTADLFTRISPNTPDKRIVTTSVSSVTNDVVLGVFSVKTQNQSATINSFSININNSTGAATTSIFQNVRLVDGSTTYGASSLAAGGTTFTNLTIPVQQDTWKDLKIMADVQSNITGVSASTTLVKSTVVGVDANFNTITLTNASNVTGNDVILQTAGLQVSGMSASANVNGGIGGNIGAGVTFTFTATNTGNSDIYISKVPSVALATSTAGSAGSPAAASSSLTYVSTSPSTLAADTGTAPTSGAYVIPSGGSRTLTYSGALDNTNGTVGLRVFKITAINFGTSAGSPTGSSVNFNLDALTVTPNLGNN